MAYLELFQRVSKHVRAQGVKVKFRRGKPLTAAAIKRAQSQSLIPIPTSLAEFYSEVGDGVLFQWSCEGEEAPFACLESPKLASRVVKSLDKINWRIEWDDSCDFRFTKNPKLAKQTALKMRKWLPLHDEGNGDQFCLDTAVEAAPVVFNQHDWFDGGSGDNGHLLGAALLDFFTQWSEVCFQFPSGLWWPRVFKKTGNGIDWRSKEFREPFRLPRG
jgi:hypothetical protein